jgi:hypothetical protein
MTCTQLDDPTVQPAAHSVDTTWFAVDREGYVAVFASREAGAVPNEAYTEYSEGALRLFDRVQRGTWLVDPAPLSAPGRTDADRHCHGDPVGDRLHNVLMFLENQKPFRAQLKKELNRGECRKAAATTGGAVFWSDLPKERFRELHDQGLCRGCTRYFGYSPDLAPPFQGQFYAYEHLFESWISGAYGRVSRPRAPKKLSDLPKAFQPLGCFRFPDLSFAETPYLQPIGMVECFSWRCAYLQLDGRTIRPIPGLEHDYEGEYHRVLKELQGYHVEPPLVSSEPIPLLHADASLA